MATPFVSFRVFSRLRLASGETSTDRRGQKKLPRGSGEIMRNLSLKGSEPEAEPGSEIHNRHLLFTGFDKHFIGKKINDLFFKFRVQVSVLGIGK